MSEHAERKRPRLTAEQKTNIAQNLRSLRIKKFPQKNGQKLCAIDMRIDPNQYAPWELGSRTPIHKNLMLIAEYFGVTFEQLCAPPHHTEPPAENRNSESAIGTALSGLAAKTKRLGRKPNQTKNNDKGRAYYSELQARGMKTKTMDLLIPMEAVNTKMVRLTYRGNITLIGIEFIDEFFGK